MGPDVWLNPALQDKTKKQPPLPGLKSRIPIHGSVAQLIHPAHQGRGRPVFSFSQVTAVIMADTKERLKSATFSTGPSMPKIMDKDEAAKVCTEVEKRVGLLKLSPLIYKGFQKGKNRFQWGRFPVERIIPVCFFSSGVMPASFQCQACCQQLPCRHNDPCAASFLAGTKTGQKGGVCLKDLWVVFRTIGAVRSKCRGLL